MPQFSMRDVGLDGHRESIAVADVAQDQGAEVVSLGTIGPRQGALDTRIRPRHAQANPLVYGDEAWPCGAWLSRELTKPGPECWVVAPSCSPQQAGDRVTTDRREARQLAWLMRAGDLTPVDVPQVAAEALRGRRRAREERLRDRNAATSRRSAFRLRQDMRSTGQAHESPAPRRGHADVVGPTPAPQRVFQAYGRAVTAPTARLRPLEQDLPARVHIWGLAPVVEAPDGTIRYVLFPCVKDNPRDIGYLPHGEEERPAEGTKSPKTSGSKPQPKGHEWELGDTMRTLQV